MQLVVNLSHPVLCPYQLFLDLFHQIVPEKNYSECVFQPICEISTTDDWINLESLGNPVTIRANELATSFHTVACQQHIEQIELHIYIGNHLLTSDNLYSLLFLADKFNSLSIFIYGHHTEYLSSINIFFQEKDNVNLCYQSYELFKTAYQQRADQLDVHREKLLQKMGFFFEDLVAHSFAVSNEQIGMLLGYAWVCLKTGAYEPACLLLSHTLAQTRSKEVYEKIFMHLQIIRFLSHQYKKVSLETFPDNFITLSKDERKSIYFIKAYAATLDRNFSVAKVFFQKCGVNEKLEITNIDSLYRLNIYALFLVLTGDIMTALELEVRIKDYIEHNKIDITGLKYVNYINIARLYKKLSDFNESRLYYDKAYEEISDGYTTSDHIYYNLNLANLSEAERNLDMAMVYWLKVAIYWLGFDNPLSLSWRPRILLCQEKIVDITQPLSIIKINTFIYNKLYSLLSNNNFIYESSDKIFNFVLDNKTDIIPQSCYVSNGIVFYASQKQDIKTMSRDNHYIALNKLVSNIIRKNMCINDDVKTIIIDTKHQNIFPKSEQAALSLSLLSGCETCFYNGNPIYYDVVKENHIKFSLSKMINNIDTTPGNIKISYKRSFMNKNLFSDDEIKFISMLNNKKTITLRTLQQYSLSFLSEMFNSQLLHIEYINKDDVLYSVIH